jgi:hypothetical protein
LTRPEVTTITTALEPKLGVGELPLLTLSNIEVTAIRTFES